jgi:hypothetical protein
MDGDANLGQADDDSERNLVSVCVAWHVNLHAVKKQTRGQLVGASQRLRRELRVAGMSNQIVLRQQSCTPI